MRPIKPSTRRQSLWRTVLLALGAIIFGGAATVVVLGMTKVIPWEKMVFWRLEPKAEPIPVGWIAVPVAARPIPAYTLITKEFLINPKTGGYEMVWTPPEMAKGNILDLGKIRGRVLAREKPALYGFTEEDFLPKGTHPGVAGGTPEGKIALTLDASNLKGCVHELKEGDHVDLQETVTVDMPGTGHTNSGPSGTKVMAAPGAFLRPKRGLVIPLVKDGVVVSPVKVRNVPVTVSSLTQGSITRTRPVEEIVIAMAPEEMAPLEEAMALKNEITCAVRSSRPPPAPSPGAHPSAGGAAQGGMSLVLATLGNALLGKGNAAAPDKAAGPREPAKTANAAKSETPAKDRAAVNVTPGLDPMAGVSSMVVQIGNERQVMLFPRPGSSPVIVPQDDGSAKTATGGAAAGTLEENK